MATIREWICSEGCEPEGAGPLFEALQLLARRGRSPCPTHSADRSLRLVFDFGLNAQHSQCTVLGSFTSKTPQEWTEKDGSRVEFFPFLIVLERHGKGRATWLPYWHLVYSKKKGKTMRKYGQWAPFMDLHLFDELLKQARTSGFLSDDD